MLAGTCTLHLLGEIATGENHRDGSAPQPIQRSEPKPVAQNCWAEGAGLGIRGQDMRSGGLGTTHKRTNTARRY